MRELEKLKTFSVLFLQCNLCNYSVSGIGGASLQLVVIPLTYLILVNNLMILLNSEHWQTLQAF